MNKSTLKNKNFIGVTISGLILIFSLYSFKKSELVFSKNNNLSLKQTIVVNRDTIYMKNGKIFIKGTVKDKNGDRMPGVNVYVEHYRIGTTSDVNGNYVLVIPDSISKCKITIDFVGYHKKEFLYDRQILKKTKKIEL